MKHPSESQLIAFLEGEMSRADAAMVDEHLLVCEPCWQAVNHDRRGRHLAESLRTAPSPQLLDRIRLAVQLAASDAQSAGPPQPRRHRRRRVAAAGVIIGLAAVGGTVWEAVGESHPSAVTAVVQATKTLETSEPQPSGPLRAPQAAQPLRLDGYRYQGALVVVAVSPDQFPMPKDAVALAGDSPMIWTATEEGINLYCINGTQPMLLAGHLPTAQLGQLASRILHH